MKRMATFLKNKKASFDYELLDRYEAGMDLLGFEVKSLRDRRGSLEGAHVVVRGGEAYLVGATIPPYQPANTPKGYDAERTRRLLLNKKELLELAGKEAQKGLTIIPISVYSKGPKLKLEIAVSKKKKAHDKRETLKKRDAEREIQRTIKSIRE